MKSRWRLAGLALAFACSAHAQDLSQPTVTARPSEEDLWKVWPMEARSLGLEGHASFRCDIAADGQSSGCILTSDSPAGLGFGAAAATLLRSMKFAPVEKGGHPIAGQIFFSIDFSCNKRCKPLDLSKLKHPLVVSPVWVRTPKPTDIAAAYPSAALADKVEGHAVLLCRFDDKGGVTDCKVTEEDPAGHGFGQAAQKLTNDFLGYIRLADGSSASGAQVRVPVTFKLDGSGKPSAARGTPKVLSTPGLTDFIKAYPEKALQAGVKTGRAVISCTLLEDGSLRDCTSASEEPANLGFGEAALSVAHLFRLSTWSVDGLPTADGPVRIPVLFEGGMLTAGQPRPRIIEQPDWERQPSGSEFSALYPVRAGKMQMTGKVILHCIVSDQGEMEDCTVASEKPERYGFGQAALAISKYFKLRPELIDGQPMGGASVAIPINFTLRP